MSSHGVRRVVTGHSDDGTAVIASDTVLPWKALDEAAEMVLAWSTDMMPSDNMDEQDGALREVGLVSAGGSVLQFVSMGPHTSSPHHRTISLDYGIVLEGELELELDKGITTRVFPGDVVVQRGTIHSWHNPADVASKMAFVLLDATPVTVGEHVLPMAVNPPPARADGCGESDDADLITSVRKK